jgi:hypothetical protein
VVERFHHSTTGVPMQVGNCSRLKTVDLSVPQEPLCSTVKLGMARSHPVQVTLRDTDETRLLPRLEKLLQRFPAEADNAEPEPQEGWCSTHGVQMKLRNGEHGAWWSHKTTQGWCKGQVGAHRAGEGAPCSAHPGNDLRMGAQRHARCTLREDKVLGSDRR